MTEFYLGQAHIDPPGPFIAGEYTSLTYIYTTGHPIDDTGYIKIVFRYSGDFGIPQFNEPEKPNYCSLTTSADCRIQPRWDAKGHIRPWGFALYLKIMGGYLNTGDQVELIFGDSSHGSPGWQMQTYCEDTFEFKTLVDPIASYQFKEILESPYIKVVPGSASKAVCIAPSTIKTNTPFQYHMKLEDRWGNPISKPQAIEHPGFNEPKIYRIEEMHPKNKLSATSNPIKVIDQQTARYHNWADFHGQSEETIGSNSIEDYFTFARDYALLNIAAHQGNDFQITDEFWDKINQTTKEFNHPGCFITFPGYEWSGNTPLGGDRNIYFTSENGKITRSSNELLPEQTSRYPISATANKLFINLKEQKKATAFSFAHVGGRYADLSMHDPDIELAVEIHSDWGTFEWLLEDALNRGYQIGICANSDGHKGRPGASYPGASKFGSYGGLTCVLAEKLDREHITAALFARHFYATTGNRLLLDLIVKDSNIPIAIMGDEVPKDRSKSLNLEVKICGTAPIERVEIFNGLELLSTKRPYTEEDLGKRIKILWSGAQVRGRDRKVNWDGNLKIVNNRIMAIESINFWNPDQQPELVNNQQISWKSITTGGVSGFILNLEKCDSGKIQLSTAQGEMTIPIEPIGLEPKIQEFGVLRKRIEIYRLPDKNNALDQSISFSLSILKTGVNPVYIRVTQEDGHMAWSSPVYIKND